MQTPQRYARAIAHAEAQPFAEFTELMREINFFLSVEFIRAKRHIKLGTPQQAVTVKQQQVHAIVKTATSTPGLLGPLSHCGPDLVTNAMILA
jgi:hypothetical protein